MWTDEYLGDNGETYSGQYNPDSLDAPYKPYEGVGELVYDNGIYVSATWKIGGDVHGIRNITYSSSQTIAEMRDDYNDGLMTITNSLGRVDQICNYDGSCFVDQEQQFWQY